MDDSEASTIVLWGEFIARQPSKWNYSSHAIANAGHGSMCMSDTIIRSTERNAGKVLRDKNATHGLGRVQFMVAQGQTREGIGPEGRRTKSAAKRNETKREIDYLTNMSKTCVGHA